MSRRHGISANTRRGSANEASASIAAGAITPPLSSPRLNSRTTRAANCQRPRMAAAASVMRASTSPRRVSLTGPVPMTAAADPRLKCGNYSLRQGRGLRTLLHDAIVGRGRREVSGDPDQDGGDAPGDGLIDLLLGRVEHERVQDPHED